MSDTPSSPRTPAQTLAQRIVRMVACRLGWHRFVDVTWGRLTECDDPLCPNYEARE